VAARVIQDLDFVFSSSERLSVSTLDGRDTCAADAERIKITLKPDDRTLEETIIDRTKLDYFRITRRTLEDESS
jgi:hypothetical protein